MSELMGGNVFILDNVTVHFAKHYLQFLNNIVTVAGVFLLYLLTYASEFNFVKPVFAQMKHHMQKTLYNQI